MKSLAELAAIRESLKVSIGYSTGIEENDVKVAICIGNEGAAEARAIIKACMEEIEKRNLEHVMVILQGSKEAVDGAPVIEVTAPGKDKVVFKNVNPDKAREIIASINNK